MQSRDEEPRTCEYCGLPAVRQHVHRRCSAWVCEKCGDQAVAQEAYDDQLIHILTLESERRYDEALAALKSMFDAHKHMDHDMSLSRGVARHEAMILLEAGRLHEAEEAFRHCMTLGFEDVSVRWLNASGLARTLDALGRTEEAVAMLEEALSHQDRRFLPSAIGYLGDLVLLSNKIGRPVDAGWLQLAAQVAERCRVALPPGDTPGEIILSLNYLLHPNLKDGDGDEQDPEDDANDPSPPDTALG